MVRPSFGHVVLAATASFAIACGNAYADTAATPPDSGTATTPQVPQGGSTSTLSGGASPDEGTTTGDDLATESEESGGAGAQDAASPDPVQPLAKVTIGDAPPGSPAGGAPPAPAPQNTGDATAKQEIDEKPATPSAPPPAAALPVAPGAPSSTPPIGQPPAPVTPAAPARPGPVAQVSSTSEPTKAGDSLEQLLTKVGRELRSAQGQIDGLRHGLDRGTAPSPDRLSRLRATLVRITPMLTALEVRLGAAGRLSPHLQQLLHGVQSDLRGVRASAPGLVVALRHSGARGDELRLLLRELRSFQALGSTLASTPGASPARPAPATSPANPQLWTAPATSSVPAPTAPPHPRAGDRRESPSHGTGDLSAGSMPASASPDAATASPGGSFSFAAAMALAMVLIALALPALLTRLDLPPGRRYAVALIAPLERPG